MILIVHHFKFAHKVDFSGGKLSLEQFTPNQIGFSRTPISRNEAQP